MTRRVCLDFETASALDLSKVGASAYAEHPSTRVLLLCYTVSDGAVQTWRAGPMPTDLRQAIESGAVIAAHNYQFEAAIWQAHQVPLGWPEIPWPRWSCTAARARVARLPGSLAGAAEALRLDQQKDNLGKLHMLRLARTAFVGGVEPSEEDLDRLADYCVRDVEVLRDLDRRLPELNSSATALAELDYRMNQRGMPVDLDLVRKLIVVRDAEDRRLTAELAELTEGAITSPNQCARIYTFLAAHGVDLPNVTADTLKLWDEENVGRDDLVAKVIRTRREFAHSAGAKLDTIVASAERSGAVRDGFVFHGAHTGRWSGRGVQLQNLPRNTLEDPEATLARLAAAAASDDPTKVQGNSADAQLSVKAQIAGVIRGLFQAPAGYAFVAVDLSQIESRVLCWLAGQQDKLDAYTRGENVYLRTAQQLGSDNRQLGKVLDLAGGFGASANVVLAQAKIYRVPLTDTEAAEHSVAWRTANQHIVSFWYALQQALCQVVECPFDAGPVTIGALTAWRTRGAIRVRLPSGRDLIYRNPRMLPSERFPERRELVIDQVKNGRLQELRLWHGQATANTVQAIAADVLTDAMLTLDREGVPIVASIHDEVVAVVPVEQAEATRQRMIEVLSTPPAWAPDLPLAAEGYVNFRYLKPKEPAHVERDEQHVAPSAGAAPRAAARGGNGADTADGGVLEGAESGTSTAGGSHDRDAALSWQIGNQTIVRADCLSELQAMAPASVDVIVTSPPYNIGVGYSRHNDRQPRETYLAGVAARFAELHRVLKLTGSFFLNIGTGTKDDMTLRFAIIDRVLRAGFQLQNDIVWVKAIAAADGVVRGHNKPVISPRFLTRMHESVLHLTKTGKVPLDKLAIGVPFADKTNIARRGHAADKRDRGSTWFINYDTVQSKAEKFDHPAGFPVELPEWCIKLHGVQPNLVVLDPFLGAGTTLVATQQLGCHSIGIEIDPQYVETARKRLSDEPAPKRRRKRARKPAPNGSADPPQSDPIAEVNRLRRIEAAARYLRNSNAWVGDADGIDAVLAELDAALHGAPGPS